MIYSTIALPSWTHYVHGLLWDTLARIVHLERSMRDGDNKDKRSFDFSFGNLCTRIPDAVFPIIGGCVAFGTTLAVSTAAQKVIGVSTATNIVPSLLGFATVCAASLVSEQTAILTHELKRDPRKRNLGYIKHKLSKTSNDIIESTSQLRGGKNHQFKLPMHEVRV